ENRCSQGKQRRNHHHRSAERVRDERNAEGRHPASELYRLGALLVNLAQQQEGGNQHRSQTEHGYPALYPRTRPEHRAKGCGTKGQKERTKERRSGESISHGASPPSSKVSLPLQRLAFRVY